MVKKGMAQPETKSFLSPFVSLRAQGQQALFPVAHVILTATLGGGGVKLYDHVGI